MQGLITCQPQAVCHLCVNHKLCVMAAATNAEQNSSIMFSISPAALLSSACCLHGGWWLDVPHTPPSTFPCPVRVCTAPHIHTRTPSAGVHKMSKVRTSSGMFFARAEDVVVKRIEDRVAAWTMLPSGNAEGMQVLRYVVSIATSV